jgi:hypothetical protein
MSKHAQSNRGSAKPRPDTDVVDEQELDDTLDDTFPASDPPAWTLGVEEDRRDGSGEDQEQSDTQDGRAGKAGK